MAGAKVMRQGIPSCLWLQAVSGGMDGEGQLGPAAKRLWCQAKTLDLVLKAAGAIGGFEQQWGWQRGIDAGEYHTGPCSCCT